ncbi:MAG: DUF3105 domain-containing protein [Actinomycetota bacterium]
MRRLAPAIALSLLLAGCGSGYGTQVAPANQAAGCDPVYSFPSEGRNHIPQGTTVSYKTEPPTSGNHMQIWGATGVYKQNAPDELMVHNLEHGHVIIWYAAGAISPDLLNGFVNVVKQDPHWVVLVPRLASRFNPRVPLAFVAWRHMQRCPHPTAGALEAANAFIARFGQHGPEHIPADPIFETPPAR